MTSLVRVSRRRATAAALSFALRPTVVQERQLVSTPVTTSVSLVQTRTEARAATGTTITTTAANRCRTRPLGRAAPLSISAARAGGSARAYSQDNKNNSEATSTAGGGESKIWSFEDMEGLVNGGKGDVVIIDVREPEELRDTGRIPGAVNMPITSAPDSFHVGEDEFEDRFGFARPARGVEAVVYCKAGVRGRAAAALARDAGWERVGEYPGSWLDWAARGGKVER